MGKGGTPFAKCGWHRRQVLSQSLEARREGAFFVAAIPKMKKVSGASMEYQFSERVKSLKPSAIRAAARLYLVSFGASTKFI